MYRLCEKQFSRLISWPTKYERCKFFADLYYKAVRTAGSLYWSNPSEGWCKNVCTEALGDPSKPLDVKMTPKMTNISVNSSHPHVKLEILVENQLAIEKQSEIKDCSRAYINVNELLFEMLGLCHYNKPLPSSKNPHFQIEAKCTTFLVKMSFICTRMKIIFISKAEHLTSFCGYTAIF